jgi:hypothetical protein
MKIVVGSLFALLLGAMSLFANTAQADYYYNHHTYYHHHHYVPHHYYHHARYSHHDYQ